MLRYVLAAIFVFAVLLAIYLATDRYLRWDTARRYSSKHEDGEGKGLTREDYVQKGLAEYERSPEKKVLLGIFVLPFVVILILVLIAG